MSKMPQSAAKSPFRRKLDWKKPAEVITFTVGDWVPNFRAGRIRNRRRQRKTATGDVSFSRHNAHTASSTENKRQIP